MRIDELKQKLKDKTIPQNVYIIDEQGITDQKMCLFKVKDNWAVYYSEKGNKFDYVEFGSESEACNEFYNKLV